jgi:DNA-directed RNA polymerase specialized sigma24 family protein
MRDYQCGHNNPYWLPQTLYRRCLALVRDYERLKAERDNIIYAGGTGDGQPHGESPVSTTEAKALRLVEIDADCDAVERALERLPAEYRRGVYTNVVYGVCQWALTGASDRTWSRWRHMLLYTVAKNKRWI